MTLSVNVKSDELLRYARQLDEMPKRNKTLIANALNEVGRSMARDVINTIADETGMPAETLRRLAVVRPATRNRHDFTLDLTAIYAPEEKTPRRWNARNSRTEFSVEELVDVVTAGDEKVCPECERIAEEGPYSLSEGQAQIPHHPHCRCQLIPHVSRQRLSFTFDQSTGAQRRVRGGVRQVQRTTLRALAEKVSREMVINLKAK